MNNNLINTQLLKEKALIGGSWVDVENGQRFDVLNPYNNQVIASLPFCGKLETKQAIKSATAAQKVWAKYSAKERSKILRIWHKLIIDNIDELARILTLEMGKPIAEAISEIKYGASYVEWFAEEAKRIDGDIIPPPDSDKRLLITREPVGVVACITPWNFPSAMITRKLAPALAAGCSVVCKPSELTPLSALALANLAEQAGIPPGVINIVFGNYEAIGTELTSNPDIRKLTFTGSTKVGKKLLADCSHTVKKTSMELGGNAPFIVFEDADLDQAVKGAINAKFRNAGQTCICANRLMVHERIYDDFIHKLTIEVEKLSTGNGIEPDTLIGPLINQGAVSNCLMLINDAVSKGAVIVAGGSVSISCDSLLEPTILKNLTTDMAIYDSEIFGPVAAIYTFSEENEALKMANDTPYGLAAYFYTQKMDRVFRFSNNLEFGMIGVNEGAISNEMIPFGGIKESGHGREGSKYGLDDYLELKYTCIGGL